MMTDTAPGERRYHRGAQRALGFALAVSALALVKCGGTNETKYRCVWEDDRISFDLCPSPCAIQCFFARLKQCEPSGCRSTCAAGYDLVSEDCQNAMRALSNCIYLGEDRGGSPLYDAAVCVPDRLPEIPLPGDECSDQQERYDAVCPAELPWPMEGGITDSDLTD
jgi:hypothetical protein